MTVFIGIDPGNTGAVAMIENNKIIFAENFPLLSIKRGNRTAVMRDRGAFLQMAKEFPKDSLVTVENPCANAAHSAISNFEMSGSMEMVFMTLLFLGIPYEKISPMVWKKQLKLHGGKENKDESIVKCQELFPDTWYLTQPFHATQNKRCKANHDRCEAVLVAVYGQRYLFNDKQGVLVA